MGFLWYPIEPEKLIETWLDYFREKLAITDPDEGRKALSQWNRTVESQQPRKVTAGIKTCGEYRMALIPGEDPSSPPMLLVNWSYLPDADDIGDYLGAAGTGGHAWVE